MTPSPPHSPALLLESAEVVNELPPATGLGGRRLEGTRPELVGSAVAVPAGSWFRAPGLAVLATVSLLEAYRWLGVIANGESRLWAATFAVVTLPAALALARREGGRPRSALRQLVVLASLATALAAAAVLWNDRGWPSVAVGVADLALALASLGALVDSERTRRGGHGTP